MKRTILSLALAAIVAMGMHAQTAVTVTTNGVTQQSIEQQKKNAKLAEKQA